MSNGNIQPPKPNSGSTVVTIVDPKLVKVMEEVKRDTEAILAKIQPVTTEPPRYFPKGYFG